MDAFETIVATLLQRDGYWTQTGFKVNLTKAEKRRIGRPSSPRWEIDVVAYKGSANKILAVECKSFLDSTGVVFRNGTFETENRYKLFTDNVLRNTVLKRLTKQLEEVGACARSAKVTLGLATGKIARKTDRAGLESHFSSKGWVLLDDEWIAKSLRRTSDAGYENDVAHVVAKILLRS